jgi:tetratricopeptide (TPR) repeat protein
VKRALAGFEKALGPEHLNTLKVIQNLDTLYHSCGKLDEAETMLKRALAGYEKVLGLEHRNTLGVVQNLGRLNHDHGKLDKAETMLKRANGRIREDGDP